MKKMRIYSWRIPTLERKVMEKVAEGWRQISLLQKNWYGKYYYTLKKDAVKKIK